MTCGLTRISGVLTRAAGTAVISAVAVAGAEAQEYRTAVSASVGTPGIGVSVGQSLSTKVGVRLAGNFFNYSDQYDQSDLTFDATLKLRTIDVLLDFHPASSPFRLTGGLVFNKNIVEGTGVPNSGTLVINGTPYPAAAVGTLTAHGDVGSRSVAPYLGLGFGRTEGDSRVFFALDMGVIFQGKPTVTLAATGPIAGVPTFQANLAAEEADINQDLDRSYFKYYPVVSIGVGVRF
jgi:hypothetical protein